MDNFEKYNSIASYKASQEVANTNPNLATYEESRKSENHVKIQNIWMDAQYIPNVAPVGQIDTDGFYQIQAFSENIPIVRKVTELHLILVNGTKATFFNNLLFNIIPFDFGDNYDFELKDTAGNTVPFGLNNWVVDGNSGTLSFLGGIPEGFSSEFIFTFWRYCGRTGPDRILFNDGTTTMVNGYIPQYNKSIVDKEYVDVKVSDLVSRIEIITPDAPSTFEGFDLVASAPIQFTAQYVLDNEERNITYSDNIITIELPEFYNQEKGSINLLVNGINIDTFNLTVQPTSNSVLGSLGTFHIEKSGYLDNIKVYKKIKMFCTIAQASLPSNVLDKKRLAIQLRYAFEQTYYYTKEVIFGFEDVRVLSSSLFGIINETKIRDLVSSGSYISGVPALRSNDSLHMDAKVYLYDSFKRNEFPMLYENYSTLKETFEISPLITYPSFQPVHNHTRLITIPSNIYSENFSFELKSMKLDQTDFHTIYTSEYPIRVDSVSDETIRVKSGTGNYPLSFGSEYDSTESLLDNLELQLINGIFKWPSGDYSTNGVFLNQSLSNVIQVSGPNYTTDISPSGIRWATFKFTIPVCNGVYITINDLVNAQEDIDSHEFTNALLFTKVLNKSGWFDANSCYNGVTDPINDGDACLIVHGSSLNKKKITFGKKAIGGEIFIRIGFLKTSNIRFRNIEVIPTT